VCKNAGIGNADKKQPLLQRKVYNVNACQIHRVESPKTLFSKNDVPGDKKQHHDDDCWEYVFPLSIKFQFGMKTIQKWNGK